MAFTADAVGRLSTGNETGTAAIALQTNFARTFPSLLERDPLGTDDVGEGYYPGMRIINTTTGIEWHCLSNADDEAVWHRIGAPDDIIRFTIDGGDSVLATGIQERRWVPYAADVIGWRIIADETGSIQFDLTQLAFTDHPGAGTTIVSNSAFPALVSAAKNSGVVSAGTWASLTLDNYVQVSITSVTSIKRVTLELKIKKVVA